MSTAAPDREPVPVRRSELLGSHYARFYGPMTVLMVVLTLLPYHAAKPGSTSTHGNIWQEVAEHGTGIDVLSLLIFLCLILLMILATLSKLSPGGLVGAAVCALIIATVLWTSPGYREKPPFTQAGVVDIVVAFSTAALMVSHAIHVTIVRRRE